MALRDYSELRAKLHDQAPPINILQHVTFLENDARVWHTFLNSVIASGVVPDGFAVAMVEDEVFTARGGTRIRILVNDGELQPCLVTVSLFRFRPVLALDAHAVAADLRQLWDDVFLEDARQAVESALESMGGPRTLLADGRADAREALRLIQEFQKLVNEVTVPALDSACDLTNWGALIPSDVFVDGHYNFDPDPDCMDTPWAV